MSFLHQCFFYNARKQKIYTSLTDFYSKNPDDGIRFISPLLPRGKYVLEMINTADSPTWTDKTKAIYGSDGTCITLKGFYVFEK